MKSDQRQNADAAHGSAFLVFLRLSIHQISPTNFFIVTVELFFLVAVARSKEVSSERGYSLKQKSSITTVTLTNARPSLKCKLPYYFAFLLYCSSGRFLNDKRGVCLNVHLLSEPPTSFRPLCVCLSGECVERLPVRMLLLPAFLAPDLQRAEEKSRLPRLSRLHLLLFLGQIHCSDLPAGGALGLGHACSASAAFPPVYRS